MGTIEREPEVIDSLDSNSTIDALSANQGKVLNEKVLTETKNVSSRPALRQYLQKVDTILSRYMPTIDHLARAIIIQWMQCNEIQTDIIKYSHQQLLRHPLT